MKQLLNWFRRGSLESGLERELQYHLDRRINELQQEVGQLRQQCAVRRCQ